MVPQSLDAYFRSMTVLPGAVLWDYDGTLVESEAVNAVIVSQMLQASGMDFYTPHQVERLFTGVSHEVMMQDVMQRYGATRAAQVVAPKMASMMHHYEGLRTVPGVLEVVQWLHAHQVPMGVVSNGQRDVVLYGLSKTGLIQWIPEPYVGTACQVPRPKPFPDLLYDVARRVRVAPASCWVVEDSPTGIRAAQTAAMHVAAFIGGAHHHEALVSHIHDLEPDLLITRYRAS